MKQPLEIPAFSDAEADRAVKDFMAQHENSAPRYNPFLALEQSDDFVQAVIEAHKALPKPIGEISQ